MRFTSCVGAIFVLATWIAIGLFLRGEQQGFLDEQVEVLVVDGGTGNNLKHFRYRTWIVTQPSGPDPEWSEWIELKSDAPLSLTALPKANRLYLPSEFMDGPHVLSGRVTDEQANLVTKFGIRVFFQKSFIESYLLEIEDPEGRFKLLLR